MKVHISFIMALALTASCQSNAQPAARQAAEAVADSPQNIVTEREPPRMGVICTWALVANAAAIGRKCPGKFDPDIQPALEASEADLAKYIIRNSSIDEAYLEQMRAQNTGAEDPIETLCQADDSQFYDDLTKNGSAGLREWTAEEIAVDRPASWEPCF